MYAKALALTAATTAATTGLPFEVGGCKIFHLGSLDLGVPIQAFGVIVAVGVLIGAWLLRRYAEWHGVSDDDIRGLLGWVTVCGFLGAHEFDMIFYNWHKIGDATVVPPASWWPFGEAMYPSNWPLPLKIWEGISSYGGFLGGSIGFAIFVWWKRLRVRLMADVTIVGLLPAFSIGRIGCTVVSDHVGAAVDPNKWYAFLAVEYPRSFGALAEHYSEVKTETIRAWNLGLVEFLYLIPVNIIVLWLAFRPSKRPKAGFLVALTGLLYAPIRFFLDFLRPEDSDPRHLGLTFAQWASLAALGAAAYVLGRIMKSGEVAETIADTAGEAQQKLKLAFKEADEEEEQERAAPKAKADDKKAKADDKKAKAEAKEDEELAKEAEAAGGAEDDGEGEEDDEDDDEADKPAGSTPAAKKPSGASSQRKKKKRRR